METRTGYGIAQKCDMSYIVGIYGSAKVALEAIERREWDKWYIFSPSGELLFWND